MLLCRSGWLNDGPGGWISAKLHSSIFTGGGAGLNCVKAALKVKSSVFF